MAQKKIYGVNCLGDCAVAGRVINNQIPTNRVLATGAFTAATGDYILFDSTGGAFTITLPLAPADKDRIRFVDIAGAVETNNVTIGRNGKEIQHLTQNMVIDKNYCSFELEYQSAYGDWWLIS